MNVEVSRLIGRRRLAGPFCGLFVELANLHPTDEDQSAGTPDLGFWGGEPSALEAL
jgi:hypothetical protein